jgi:hypothetical protein
MGTLLALSPALPLVTGVEPALAREADRLLLTQRVGHHTDPLLFSVGAYRFYGGLLAAWLLLGATGGGAPPWRVWRRFVAASLVIAAVGLFVGWLPEFTQVDRLAHWRVWMLKFYPFRLADLALPMGVALEIARLVAGLTGRARAAAAGVVAALGCAAALLLPAPDANPSGMSPDDYEQWIAACEWLRRETPRTALIGCANKDWAVKWFAHRPEYVNFKDCPQDAAGVVEWWRRRQGLVAWSRAAKADGSISTADLDRLHELTGIDYLIVSRYGPIEPDPIHEQGPFRIYRVNGSVRAPLGTRGL